MADVSTTLSVTANGTPGSTITATAIFTNNGPSAAANVVGTIVKPDGTTQSTAIGTLVSGATTQLVVTYTVPAGSTTIPNWTAGVVTTTAESTTANNTVTAATNLTASADLVLTKVASSASGTAGGTISYTVTLVNLGPSVAQNVTLTDVMSAGLTLSGTPVVTGGILASSNASGATATAPTLGVNQTLTMVINATVTASTGVVTNTASGTSTTPDPTPPVPVPVPTPVTPVADVSTTLSVTANGTPGSTITATAIFTNNGPSAAANVVGTIVLPGGAIQSVVIGSLASGASTQTVASYSIPTAIDRNQTWAAGVVTSTAESTLANNTVTAVTAVGALADVSTTLRVSGSGSTGGAITATVTFTNNGPSTAQSVTGTIVTPGGVTQTIAIGSLTAGARTVTVVTYIVPADAPTLQTWMAGVVTNTAERTLVNNTVTTATGIRVIADLSTTLSVSANGTPGSTITATAIFTNNGPSTAHNVTGNIVLPSGMTQTIVLGSIPPKSNTVTVVSYAVPVDSASSLAWTAGVVSTTQETTLSNNTVTGVTTLMAMADLALSKVASISSAMAGSTISYTVTLVNLGPSVAQNVTLTDVLSAGLTLNGTPVVTGGSLVSSSASGATAAAGSLGVGQTLTMVINATVTASAGVVTNTAAGTSTTPDPRPNNTVTVPTPVTALADVSVQLQVPTLSAPGTTIQATVIFANAGPSVAQFVTGTVILPNGSKTAVFTASAMPAGSTTVVIVSYAVPAAQTTVMNWTATVSTVTPEITLANNLAQASTGVGTVTNATVSGLVWFDLNRNRVFDGAPVDQPLAGFRVELLKGATVVGSGVTGANGTYLIGGQVPGTGYTIRFLDPTGKQVYGTPFNQSAQTLLANPSTGVSSLTSAVSPEQAVPVAGAITGITLYAGDNVIQQNLPVDPSGVVYDSVSRQPIAGAIVTLTGPPGFDPAIHLVGGSNVSTTQGGGFYQFLLNATAPSGNYGLQVTPPSGYAPGPATQGGVTQPGTLNPVPSGAVLVQPQSTAPAVGVNGSATQYYLAFGFVLPTSGQVFNNHVPLDPQNSSAILVNKTGNKTIAELGDSVQYTILLRNTSGSSIASVVLEDVLPVGFRYIPGTARLSTGSGTSTVADPIGTDGRQLNFNIGSMPAGSAPELTYFVRIGAGSQTGDGTNRATAVFPGPGNTPVRSNTAAFKVTVQGGVFTGQGCIIGKVYMDCDGNLIQNNSDGAKDLGIPGVRLVLLDGTYVITDIEGKYSLCGIKSQTQVIKVDRSTLPSGSRLVPSSNRNAGVGDSIFVDMRGGEMARADFIEGSCSPGVLDQVKARRSVGSVIVPALQVPRGATGGRP